jgi:hypothetical protein
MNKKYSNFVGLLIAIAIVCTLVAVFVAPAGGSVPTPTPTPTTTLTPTPTPTHTPTPTATQPPGGGGGGGGIVMTPTPTPGPTPPPGGGGGGVQLPCAFHGTVQVNGQNVADGTVITATIGNDTYTTTTTDSAYRVVIAQPEGKSYDGLIVTFKIGSDTAAQTGIWQMGGNVALNLTKGTGAAQVTRHLPSNPVSPGQTFDVTVTFTAPADSFNSIGLVDDAPAGWAVQGNVAWCTPNANFLNAVGSEVQYLWAGSYSSGQTFTALYKVTVPVDASLLSYTFSGQLGYKIGGGSTIFEAIAGDFAVQLGRTPVTGITREVNGEVLAGVSISFDGIGPVVSDQSGQYEIMASSTGNYTVVAHKDGFRDMTRIISIAGLGSGYAVTCNFQGTHGLIPCAPDIWYALDCINRWLYPPNPDTGLDIWTALDVINAWLYPGCSLADIYGRYIGDVKYDQVVTVPEQTQQTMYVYIKDAWLSDKMKFRYEMTAGGTITIILIDMATGISYTYLPDQNIAYQMEMSENDPTENSEEIIPVKLGTETIDGKLCDVYQWTYQDVTAKEWIWREKSFPIRMESTTSSGTTIIEYKNIVFGTLWNSLFQLPAGVQIIPMPTPTP